jgi:hypothetical protein
VPSPGARIAQALLVLLAALGGIAGFAWATGLIGFLGGSVEGEGAHPPEANAEEEREPTGASSTPSARHAPVAQPRSSGGEAPARVARYAVCGREEAPAKLYALTGLVGSGVDSSASLWAVSCGASAHVIAIEAEQGVVVARRVARLEMPSPAPDRAPRPAPLALLARDSAWLLTTLRVDRNGSPAGGALFRVPLDAGDLLGTASRVHDAAPGALALATFDRAEGQDFALVQLGDARVSHAGELWLFSGGAAPRRIARRTIDADAFALATLDLDSDGSDESAVLARSGRITVHAVNDKTPALSANAPGSDALYAFDLDGDRALELVAGGAHAQRFRLDNNTAETNLRQLTAAPVSGLDGLRDLVELDVDADGRRELAGYAHPKVVAVSLAKDGTASARRTLFELIGEQVAVLQAQPAQLDGDGRIDLIALIASENNDPQVELVIATEPPDITAGEARVRIPSGGNELRNAPLMRKLELR